MPRSQQRIEHVVALVKRLFQCRRRVLRRDLPSTNRQMLFFPVIRADMTTPLFQVARHDHAIPAIVARADEHEKRQFIKRTSVIFFSNIAHQYLGSTSARVLHQYL